MAQIRFAGREGEHIELTRSALDLLDDGLDGRLIRRGADSYDKARQVWNGMVDKRSAALAAPGASSQTNHFGRRPGFVDKDQARVGSRSDWPLNHANRRRATSGRSCSAACAVFFEADPLALEEIPDLRRAGRDLTPLRQALGNLRQADIRARINQAQNKLLMASPL